MGRVDHRHDAGARICSAMGRGGAGRGTHARAGGVTSTTVASVRFVAHVCVAFRVVQIQEAKLCREAEISYAVCALATDYDAWRPGQHVSVEEVVATMSTNVVNARKVLKAVVPRIAEHAGPSPMSDALAGAIQTAPEAVSKEKAAALAPLVGKYF